MTLRKLVFIPCLLASYIILTTPMACRAQAATSGNVAKKNEAVTGPFRAGNVQGLSATFRTIHRRIRNALVEIRAIGITKTVRKIITTTTRELPHHAAPKSTVKTKTVTTVVTTTNVGSGVICSTRGYIVTNDHVVFNAKTISVILADRRTYPARLIGADPEADIAVLKITAPFLTSARFGHSSMLHVGQWVLDFGAPFQLAQSMTQGIISALHRRNNHVTSAQDPQIKLLSHEDFIQVDSPSDPGSSGGPLVNLRGHVVGINESIKSGGGGSFSGVGFAIPAREVVYVLHQIIKTGRVKHGHLGIGVTEKTIVTESAGKKLLTTGLYVKAISAHSAAARTGLKIGDLIVAINGKRVYRVAQLRNRVAFSAPGTLLNLTVCRKNKRVIIQVRTGARDEGRITNSP